MAGASNTRDAWTAGHWLKLLLVSAWIVGCDAWIKATAKVAACSDVDSVPEAFAPLWAAPAHCELTDFWGIARLSPVTRRSGPWGLADGSLGTGAGSTWAYALLGIAVVVTIAVVLWRWRSTGDALALGTLWGGVIIEAAPRLAGDGAGLAELHLGGLATGLGDVALTWAFVWLLWRFIAETRA